VAAAVAWLAGFLDGAFFTRFLAGAAFFAAFLAGAVFVGFFAALTLAHRFRCASAIAFRAFALNLRRFAVFLVGGATLSILDSSPRAFWSLSSSASIAAMIEFVSIGIFLSQKSYNKLSGIRERAVWQPSTALMQKHESYLGFVSTHGNRCWRVPCRSSADTALLVRVSITPNNFQ